MAESEIMGYLMPDRVPDAIPQLLFRRNCFQNRMLENRYFIRRIPAPALPAGQRRAFVQAEQALPAAKMQFFALFGGRLVGIDDGYVPHGVPVLHRVAAIF